MPDDISAIMSEHPVEPQSRSMFGHGHDYVLMRYEALDAISAMGAVAYAIRFGSLIKIGWTADLRHRMATLSSMAAKQSQTTELLAFRFMEEEAEEVTLHRTLTASVHHGREWYHPTAEVLAVVNEWREAVGRQPIAA